MPTIRPATPEDLDVLFEIRATTRDNAIPRERLAELGITPTSLAEALSTGAWLAWVAEDPHTQRILGFSGADPHSGEMTVLAVREGAEGGGLGRALLDAAVDALRERGHARPWLMAGRDDALRSHGFYRAQGWRPTGRTDDHGDEELVLDPPPGEGRRPHVTAAR